MARETIEGRAEKRRYTRRLSSFRALESRLSMVAFESRVADEDPEVRLMEVIHPDTGRVVATIDLEDLELERCDVHPLYADSIERVLARLRSNRRGR